MAKKGKRKLSSKTRNTNFKDRDHLTDTGGESRASVRDRDCTRSKPNAWQWYAHSEQLVKDYGSFPFGDPLGSLLPQDTLFYTAQDTDGKFGNVQAAIPGVCAIKFAPSIGNVNSETDAVNIAMRNIYSYVRHANSGHSNYEGPDLMIYLLAMDSVYMYHAYMKRLYGVLLDYTPLNRYYPKALVQAMGANFESLQEHMNDLRGYINQYTVRIGSMCVPNSMSYMARHTWMCEGLYTDSKAAKAQTYFYTPEYFLQLTSPTETDPTNFLTYVGLPKNATFEQLIAFGDSLLNPIIINEDMNIMSGDILKAFGAEGIVKVDGIADGYMVLPMYDSEVLSQIENCRVLGGSISGTITQAIAIGTGYLVSDVTLSAQPLEAFGSEALPSNVNAIKDITNLYEDVFNGRKILNFHIDGVTPDAVMVATRGIFNAYGWNQNGQYIETKSFNCGSEIYTNAHYAWYQDFVSTGRTQLNEKDVGSIAMMMANGDPNTNLNNGINGLLWTANMWSVFDWAPHILLAYMPFDNSTTAYYHPSTSGIMADYDNYTYLDSVNVGNLNKVALLSEFSVPQMGTYSLGL
nr:putative capsid [Marmot picobirnavirus]